MKRYVLMLFDSSSQMLLVALKIVTYQDTSNVGVEASKPPKEVRQILLVPSFLCVDDEY